MTSPNPPTCGAQQPGAVPSPFDWPLFAGIGVAGAALAYWYNNGATILDGIIGYEGPALAGSAATAAWSSCAALVGAGLVIALVGYSLLQPDGCLRQPQNGQPICVSGIVESVTDLNSVAINILAPWEMGPEAEFWVVVKTEYLYWVTKNAYWVQCSQADPPAPMLLCAVKSITSCAARYGAAAGALVGGAAGIITGFVVGGAIASLSCGPFAPLCFILAMIVAAIVAAAITYVGAVAGGLIGEAVSAAATSGGGDPIGGTAKSLTPGTIVTVQGNLVSNVQGGWIFNQPDPVNQLYYVTDISRTGNVLNPPSYTTAQADLTPSDDCPTQPSNPNVPALQ
jgi:hypothetical protein